MRDIGIGHRLQPLGAAIDAGETGRADAIDHARRTVEVAAPAEIILAHRKHGGVEAREVSREEGALQIEFKGHGFRQRRRLGQLVLRLGHDARKGHRLGREVEAHRSRLGVSAPLLQLGRQRQAQRGQHDDRDEKIAQPLAAHRLLVHASPFLVGVAIIPRATWRMPRRRNVRIPSVPLRRPA